MAIDVTPFSPMTEEAIADRFLQGGQQPYLIQSPAFCLRLHMLLLASLVSTLERSHLDCKGNYSSVQMTMPANGSAEREPSI